MTTLGFIHGMFSSADCWSPWVPFARRKGYTTVQVNLRGHGLRPDTELKNASIRDYADDAREQLYRHDDIVLIGHSMGGLITQLLSAERDLPIRGAVLIGSAPPAGIRLRGSVQLRMLRPRHLIPILTGNPFAPHWDDLKALQLGEVENAEGMRSEFGKESGRAARDIVFWRIYPDPRAISAPIMVAMGERDRFIPPALQEKIVQRYRVPEDNVLRYSGGHMPMNEACGENVFRAILNRIATW